MHVLAAATYTLEILIVQKNSYENVSGPVFVGVEWLQNNQRVFLGVIFSPLNDKQNLGATWSMQDL